MLKYNSIIDSISEPKEIVDKAYKYALSVNYKLKNTTVPKKIEIKFGSKT